MGGRLSIHAGDGFALLANEAFVFRRAPQAADQAIDLPAAQQGIQPRRHDTRAAAGEFELVFVLAEDIPGFHTRIAGTQADCIAHVAQVGDALEYRQSLRGFAVVVGRECAIQVLPHVDDNGGPAGAPP